MSEPAPESAAPSGAQEKAKSGDEPLEVVVRGRPSSRGRALGRASTKVERRDIEERLPRSAPDALRYEPGVYVQQTSHGQGSPYVRGRTGQQTVVLFDGIRMNTSTWRQGPNQYFFTVDSQSLRSIEVVRGGASTFYGSDAIAGVINARPLEPRVLLGEGFSLRPRASLRLASADGEITERFQIDAQLSERARALVGVGARRAGELEGGGEVRSPLTGARPQVPALDRDGYTQLGTGYRELTADGRFAFRLSDAARVVAAAYLYRQVDSPRTDQCPPPYAPRGECMKYDEQFRSLAYALLDGDLGPAARALRLAVSYQRQHERRTTDRPGSFVKNGGRDDVDTLGVTLSSLSGATDVGPLASARLRWGADAYADFVSSAAWTEFTDIEAVIPLSRGQYIEGARYGHGGAFLAVEATLFDRLDLQVGGRGGAAFASSPVDPSSGTSAIERAFPGIAGHAGAKVQLSPHISVGVYYDRSYRAPNLDDMTSRQQSGPGFQFENPALEPEAADTFEASVHVDHPIVESDVWIYRSYLRGAMTRALRTSADCPPDTPQCASSWSRFQLVNAAGASTIDGAEGWVRLYLPFGLSLRAMVSYAFGEGPNPQPAPSDPSLPYEERVPLSRIPPLNGALEVRWDALSVASFGAAMRWATLQDRLAITDRSDERIPKGGTPGYAVLDVRAGLRIGRELILSAIFENVADTPYRVHGSSVNGPGRGVLLAVEAGR